jgi:hypothetical protein
MTKLLVTIAFIIGMLFSGHVLADPPTANEVRVETIKDLHLKGMLTTEQEAQALSEVYQKADVKLQEASETSWTRWLSWVNLLKTIAIVALLICFSGIIKNMVKACWFLITGVPTWLYQLVLFGVTTLGLAVPETFSVSQSFYIALFCAFAAPMVAIWTITTYPKLTEAVLRFFSLGIPPSIVASFYAVLYFGVLTVCYDSQIFGFFAAVSFSSLFGFGMSYLPGTLYLDIRRNWAPVVVFSHTLVLMLYVALKHAGVPYVALFASGFEYYCSIALGIALLVEISPFMDRINGGALLRGATVITLANFGYSYFGEHAIGAIIDVCAFLIILDWLLWASWKTGMIIGTGVTGLLLYFGALVMENQGHRILALFS